MPEFKLFNEKISDNKLKNTVKLCFYEANCAVTQRPEIVVSPLGPLVMWSKIMSWLNAILIGYLLLLAIMFVMQRSLLYPASKERPLLTMVNLDGLREVHHSTADGLELLHWYRPPARQETRRLRRRFRVMLYRNRQG